jgi:hypothetical protein
LSTLEKEKRKTVELAREKEAGWYWSWWEIFGLDKGLPRAHSLKSKKKRIKVKLKIVNYTHTSLTLTQLLLLCLFLSGVQPREAFLIFFFG